MELKGIKLISGFALNSNQPLDSRAIVSSISELSSLVTEDIAYVGMIVYVNSDDDKKGLYVYNGESWKPVATSSSIGDISLDGYATKDYVNDAIANIDIPKVDLSDYAKKSELFSKDYNDLINKPDYLPLSGGNLTGALTVNGGGGIDTNGYVTSTWLKTTSATDLNKAASKVAVIDASGWIYYRTPAELMSDMGAASKTDVDSLIEISSDGKTLTINI